jgi:hypothetical protein
VHNDADVSYTEGDDFSKYTILQPWYSLEPRIEDMGVSSGHRRGRVKMLEVVCLAQIEVKLERLKVV